MKVFRFTFLSIIVITIVTSCNHRAKDGTELSKNERAYIHRLGILDEGEQIILFDAQADIETSGNFFTNKRVAAYWIEKDDSAESSVDYALYKQIDTIIPTDQSSSLTYSSFMEVVRNDGTRFKIYVDGERDEVQTFFEKVIAKWKEEKQTKR
jgi:hypothetical protein